MGLGVFGSGESVCERVGKEALSTLPPFRSTITPSFPMEGKPTLALVGAGGFCGTIVHDSEARRVFCVSASVGHGVRRLDLLQFDAEFFSETPMQVMRE